MTFEKYLKKIQSKMEKSDFFSDNFEMLEENLLSMFDFSGFPETFNTNFFMKYAIRTGGAVMLDADALGWERQQTEEPEGIITVPLNLAGVPDPYGMGSDVICTTRDGHSAVINDYRNSSLCEVFFLNRLYVPDIGVLRAADFLTETDLSTKAILYLARYNKILEVPDSQVQEKISAAIKASEEGKVATFVNQRKPSLIDDEDFQQVKDISINDVRNNDMIQYLSKFRDDVLREFFQRYGMQTGGAEKMAQQSVSEISAGGFRSLIIPISRLKNLQDFCDRANKKFGLSCSVDFSEPWKLEIKRLLNQEDMLDQTEDEPEDQTEDEPEDQTEDEPEDQTEDEPEDQTEDEPEDQTEDEPEEGEKN